MHKIQEQILVGLLISIIGLFSLACQKNNEQKIYISPSGKDSHSGSKEKPLASLIGARNAIRKYRESNSSPTSFTVIIADGYYEMEEPLILAAEDGGSQTYPITYRAEIGATPVFSGGRKIHGFKPNKDGIWEFKIPEKVMKDSRFDQLYVNGKRADLARTPNSGFLKIEDIEERILLKGEGRFDEKAMLIISFNDNCFQALDDVSDEELEQVRFRAYHKWDFTLRFIDKLDKTNKQIQTSGKKMKSWNPLKKGTRIVFENFRAALDTAGEWYLDKTGVLYYFPREGERPENSEVIIPVLPNLVSLNGNASQNKFIEHINFEGLSLKHCSYQMPNTGSEPNQAATLINAAVMAEDSRNIKFKNCNISQTGQHALWFGKGCSNGSVEHCYLNDLGGGGIYLGDTEALKGDGHTNNIKIHNNIIQGGGLEFPSAVGVWVGHSSDCEISHNDISNFYYTGVSVGWVWGYKESLAKRNKITHNHIHHIGWALLSDMAAVYTLGQSEGTLIVNNVVHHVNAYSYGGWGLYTDEGSSGILIENNLVYNTKTGGFHQHYGKENVVRNNIFAFAKMYQVQCTRVEEHRSFDFENNIVVFNEGEVLQGAWENIDITMDNNLYWNTAEQDYIFNSKSFDIWQNTGHDSNSIIANPYFKNPKEYCFEIEQDDNIRKIGFTPFDISKVGVYGENNWLEKARLPENILKDFDDEVYQNNRKE